ncbi:MAG: hypothetical protein ACUVTF_00505 [bacterium]
MDPQFGCCGFPNVRGRYNSEITIAGFSQLYMVLLKKRHLRSGTRKENISNYATLGKFFYFRLYDGEGYRHIFVDEGLSLRAEWLKDVMFNNISSLEGGKDLKNISL